jgi:hypothetical protein
MQSVCGGEWRTYVTNRQCDVGEGLSDASYVCLCLALAIACRTASHTVSWHLQSIAGRLLCMSYVSEQLTLLAGTLQVASRSKGCGGLQEVWILVACCICHWHQ